MISIPHRKSLALIWRRTPERYAMAANKCTICNSIYFPQRVICPKCRRHGKMEKVEICKKGSVYSYTTIQVCPDGFEKYVPYTVAIVELDEGPKITGQLVDVKPEDVKIGMRVKTQLRKMVEEGRDGIIHYSFKFIRDDDGAIQT